MDNQFIINYYDEESMEKIKIELHGQGINIDTIKTDAMIKDEKLIFDTPELLWKFIFQTVENNFTPFVYTSYTIKDAIRENVKALSEKVVPHYREWLKVEKWTSKEDLIGIEYEKYVQRMMESRYTLSFDKFKQTTINEYKTVIDESISKNYFKKILGGFLNNSSYIRYDMLFFLRYNLCRINKFVFEYNLANTDDHDDFIANKELLNLENEDFDYESLLDKADKMDNHKIKYKTVFPVKFKYKYRLSDQCNVLDLDEDTCWELQLAMIFNLDFIKIYDGYRKKKIKKCYSLKNIKFFADKLPNDTLNCYVFEKMTGVNLCIRLAYYYNEIIKRFDEYNKNFNTGDMTIEENPYFVPAYPSENKQNNCIIKESYDKCDIEELFYKIVNVLVEMPNVFTRVKLVDELFEPILFMSTWNSLYAVFYTLYEQLLEFQSIYKEYYIAYVKTSLYIRNHIDDLESNKSATNKNDYKDRCNRIVRDLEQVGNMQMLFKQMYEESKETNIIFSDHSWIKAEKDKDVYSEMQENIINKLKEVGF